MENRFRALERSGNSGAQLQIPHWVTFGPLGPSSQSLHDVQMRVQECYANVLRLGGQFAEEKERRSLMFQNIKNDLRKYIREEISEHSKKKMEDKPYQKKSRLKKVSMHIMIANMKI